MWGSIMASAVFLILEFTWKFTDVSDSPFCAISMDGCLNKCVSLLQLLIDIT